MTPEQIADIRASTKAGFLLDSKNTLALCDALETAQARIAELEAENQRLKNPSSPPVIDAAFVAWTESDQCWEDETTQPTREARAYDNVPDVELGEGTAQARIAELEANKEVLIESLGEECVISNVLKARCKAAESQLERVRELRKEHPLKPLRTLDAILKAESEKGEGDE